MHRLQLRLVCPNKPRTADVYTDEFMFGETHNSSQPDSNNTGDNQAILHSGTIVEVKSGLPCEGRRTFGRLQMISASQNAGLHFVGQAANRHPNTAASSCCRCYSWTPDCLYAETHAMCPSSSPS